jgi:ABC-type molybdate transport system substrate-binding protein
MDDGRRYIPSIAAILLAFASARAGAEPTELRLVSAASMQTVFKEVNESAAAAAFLAFLRTPDAVAVMKTKGMRVD